jgi:hypothetical protein
VRVLPAYRWYVGLAIFATGLVGWGSEQVVMRGNVEGWMWLAICAGAYFLTRRQYTAAAVAFGLACCIKPQPVLWFVLLLRHKQVRAVVTGALAAGGVWLGSLLAINPNPMQAYRMITGKGDFFGLYVVAMRPLNEMIGDHSLLQSMKTLARFVRDRTVHLPNWEFIYSYPNDPLARTLYHVYLPIGILIGLVSVWRVWNKPMLNQIFTLCAILTVLPMVTADYTLTILLIPAGFFLIFLLDEVATGRVAFSQRAMLWVLLPLSWTMATCPLNALHGVLKCAAILVLLWAGTEYAMPMRMLDGPVVAKG